MKWFFHEHVQRKLPAAAAAAAARLEANIPVLKHAPFETVAALVFV